MQCYTPEAERTSTPYPKRRRSKCPDVQKNGFYLFFFCFLWFLGTPEDTGPKKDSDDQPEDNKPFQETISFLDHAPLCPTGFEQTPAQLLQLANLDVVDANTGKY
jgi:hypothetical protein